LFLLITMCIATAGCSSQPEEETEARLRERSQQRLAQLEGEIQLQGLEQPVEILRDTWGVAHVYASTPHDLFFAQGFVAAQDRLYQMEIWRRTGAGELSEVFGPDYIERDRMARLLRYRGDMDTEWQSYAPDARPIAEAFTRGVNAFVRSAAGRLPVEFELLDFEPGEWKPEHCLLRVATLPVTDNYDSEFVRAELVMKAGAEIAARLLPPNPMRPLIPDLEAELRGIDSALLARLNATARTPALWKDEGSNNWAVSGARTASGKPLLASDPHRAIALPSLRYLVHLVAPGWNVIGSGEPALPGVAIGHNEKIAWGFTVVHYDQADLYIEKTDPENPNRYLYQGQWLDMQVERESIKVRGRDEDAGVEIRFTRHGPVIWEDPATQRALALRWVGSEPGSAGYLASLSLDRARNWDDFVASMERWKTPSENFVYADVDGNIGWIPAGLVPIRESWDGLLPVPGHSGKHEWQGFRSLQQLPRKFNPPNQYVATANHDIRPENYPHDLGFDWSPPYRFRRVDEVLREEKKFTLDDFRALQHDEASLPARELIPLLREIPDEARGARQARDLLLSWDQVLSKDSGAAALYEVWIRELRRMMAAENVPPDVRALVIEYMPADTLIGWLHAAPAEKRVLLVRTSLETAFSKAGELLGEDASAWRWGSLHQAIFRHPLADTPAREAALNLGSIERGGDAHTPNATGGPGYRQATGASYRHILDTADWDRSIFTSTPGQSGQPGSPHYGDLLPLWAAGEYAPLLFTREAVEKHVSRRLTLHPQ
jgi:penicillin amidase